MNNLLPTKQKLFARLTTTLTLVVGLFSLTVQKVSAEITNPAISETLGTDSERAASGQLFAIYFSYLWNALITVGGISVLIYFLWGAMEWITAGGDSSKLEKARLRILHSFIGLLILVSSFTIIAFIGQIFFGDNFSILNFKFSTTGITP